MGLIRIDNGPAMNSREIAELTGKNHGDVCRDIRTMLESLGGESSFASSYTTSQNKQATCYNLPYRETMILTSGYSVELRAKVVDRWMELELLNRPKPPTGSELLALAVLEAQKVIAQKDAVIETMRPAVQFMADVTGSRDAIEMSQVAKIIGMGYGRNQLFDLLRESKVLRSNNEPYQSYVDLGWFRVIEQKWQDTKGETHITIKTLVYQKGIDGIIKIIRSKE